MSNFDKVKYDNNYIKNNYDRLNIQVQKGQKAVIEMHWKSKGYLSLNAYINELIKRDMGIPKEINTSVSIQGNVNNMTTNGDINISNSN